MLQTGAKECKVGSWFLFFSFLDIRILISLIPTMSAVSQPLSAHARPRSLGYDAAASVRCSVRACRRVRAASRRIVASHH